MCAHLAYRVGTLGTDANVAQSVRVETIDMQ